MAKIMDRKHKENNNLNAQSILLAGNLLFPSGPKGILIRLLLLVITNCESSSVAN